MAEQKRKFFLTDNKEAAAKMAEEFFGKSINEIVIEDNSGAPEDQTRLFHAFMGWDRELDNVNADYRLSYESDGVYLELYMARGTGYPLDKTALVKYIIRKNISGLDEKAVNALAAKGEGRAKTAPAQKEQIIGEDIEISIAKDESEARVTLLPAEPGGAAIEFGAAKQKLLLAGISHGLDEAALKAMIDEKHYGQSCTVATSTPPEDGIDGTIIFHFQTDKKTAKPKELEGGKVDFRDLDLFVPVAEGQVLVTREFATEGTPGTTVKGRAISQKRGKEAVLPKGKNVTINLEKTEMLAKSTGMVEVINGSVNVSNVYKVDGDVNMGVGNIDFNGSVHITGNVNAGHVIKATGGVFIGGVVEASEIYAGGNVEVKRGMQGMDKGRIEARGSISLLYIERGVAIAGGSITVDAGIHSVIRAGDSLYAKGKRGSIFGGQASASTEIVVNSLGSVSHIQTDIEVGAMPHKRDRLTFLEGELQRLNGEMVKLDQLDAYLKKTKGKLDEATWDKLRRSGLENRRVNTEVIEEYTDEMNSLSSEMEQATEGKVHVFGTVHPGVRITIASDTYRVNEETTYATFKYRDMKVIWSACEMRKG